VAALRASEMLRKNFGAVFVDYYAHLKAAELARFKAESVEGPEVTAWEQNEYFDLF
jgi:glutamine synthetase